MSKKEKKKGKGKAFMYGAGFGALLGAVAALFYAPEKGSQLKKDVKEQAKKAGQLIRTQRKEWDRVFAKAAEMIPDEVKQDLALAKSKALAKLKDAQFNMSQSDYMEMVEGTLNQLRKSKKISKDKLSKIKREMNKLWGGTK